MSTFRRGLAAFGIGAVMVTCLSTTAVASAGAEEPASAHRATGTLAEYNGRTINLARDWEGADYCIEETAAKFRCVDLPAAEFGAAAIQDCREGSLCLWDNRNYQAAGLELRSSRRHDLADHGFRDRANSVYNYRESNSRLIDLRSAPVSDREYTVTAGGKLWDLGQIVYPGGGNWNNKIDVVVLN
ncbi:Peptidase inhibitor family I36 [Actinokineospora iranica]|uniref:Peptidase inhibitor family I36 n=2 Tax=Actinokineospora iranica TaxID=1271860 RepID=A0A1G6ZIP2_9PSEU|nr:peptidase inhibitor family I36 protein [Actinokineospora iranica]SDE02478.1 Peptidase inhibitor family I36 [Actinokineospora iranica]